MQSGLSALRLRQYFASRYDDWLRRRLPPARELRLDHSRLFVFPSAAGGGFLLLLVLLWVVATNYENNLVFGFTFLLTALFVIGIFHAVANLAGVTVTGVRGRPAFAGEVAEFQIALSQQRARARHEIRLSFVGAVPVTATLVECEAVTLGLAVASHRRGWLDPGRLTLTSHYPLGLFRAWTHLDVDLRALVYPRPVPAVPVLRTFGGRGQGQLAQGHGSEDFRGLERYRAGDSLRRVAWKAYAREQGLHSKDYADPVDEQIWLAWDAFPGMDREARLSRLCGWLLAVSATGQLHGLRLPGVQIPLGSGDRHRDAILRALALYELEPAPPAPPPPFRAGAL